MLVSRDCGAQDKLPRLARSRNTLDKRAITNVHFRPNLRGWQTYGESMPVTAGGVAPSRPRRAVELPDYVIFDIYRNRAERDPASQQNEGE